MSESATRRETDAENESIDREVKFDPIALLDAGNVIVSRDLYNGVLFTKRDGMMYLQVISENDTLEKPVRIDEATIRRNIRKANGEVEIHAENPYDA